MGRYYSGDIEGKFWFGVQNSTDASFFGGKEYEPNHISYYFDKEYLPDIKKGLKKCKKKLGKYKKKLDSFFDKNNGYTDKKLATAINVNEKELSVLMEWYAREILGQKILECVKERGVCDFDAEL